MWRLLVLALLLTLPLQAKDRFEGKIKEAYPDTAVFETFQNCGLYWGSTTDADNEYLITFKLAEKTRMKILRGRTNPFEGDAYLYEIEVLDGEHQGKSGWIGEWELTRTR